MFVSLSVVGDKRPVLFLFRSQAMNQPAAKRSFKKVNLFLGVKAWIQAFFEQKYG